MPIIKSRIARGMMTAALILCVAGLGDAGQKEKEKEKKKLDKSQQKDVEELAKVVDAAAAGQPAPSDIAMSWNNDFMQALDLKIYVPFTVSIDPKQIAKKDVAVYLRVVARPGTAPAEAPKDKPSPSPFAFEDAHFLELAPAEAGGHYRVSRAFAVPKGDYDVYVALRERSAPKGTAPKVGLLKQQVTVPDFWNDELNTSSIILAQKITPLSSPIPQDEQAERPYSLGATEIVPALDSTFSKKDELSLIFMVYNPTLGSDTKPNVTTEYNFYQKTSAGEKYFNKTSPQDFNATTLPPQFDLAAGHQLVAGQAVPLSAFPVGDYRLEIKITDKNSKKTLTRNVTFSLSE